MKMPPARPSITIIILTRNEEKHLARCLERISPIAARILIIDSFSTDATLEIAARFGAEIHQNIWVNYASQFQWALDNLEIETDWVMRLDADEYCEPALIEEILSRVPALSPDVSGIALRRKVIFNGRFIRHGGIYPTVLLRLFRTGLGRIEQRWMDEHCVVESGATVLFQNDLVDENLNDISWWTEKHNAYATRQMIDLINQEFGLFPEDEIAREGAHSRTRLRRFQREKIFAPMPLYLRASLYFLYRYVLRLGFLDGRPGFLFHFLQGWWNWVLVDAKIEEARGYIQRNGVDAFRQHLATRHGHHLPVPASSETSPS